MLIVGVACPAQSEGSAPAASAGQSKFELPVDDQKAALIKKLLSTVQSTRNAKMGMNTVLEESARGFTVSLNDALTKDTTLTPEQKMEKRKAVLAFHDQLLARLKQLMLEKVDMDKLVNDVYLKVYDKHFTAEEIQDQLNFYQSPTGQKVITELPQLTHEALELMNVVFIPKLHEIDTEIMKEMKAGSFGPPPSPPSPK